MRQVNRTSMGSICNLCLSKYRRKSIYTRYCDRCRRKDLYRFAECFASAAGAHDESADDMDSFVIADFGVIA